MKRLRIWLLGFLTVISVFSVIPEARAFCGFYVTGADTELYNQAFQVAIARDGNQTVLTMANDYKGTVADFALVVPVLTLLQPEQVRVINPELLTQLDTYSAPRLVEYPAFEKGPCSEVANLIFAEELASAFIASDSPDSIPYEVTVESSFTVGEYSIAILNA